MRRSWIVAVVALVATACGGDVIESGDVADNGTVMTNAGSSNNTASSTSSPGDDDERGDAPTGVVNKVTVTIGGQTYEMEIDLENALHRCDPDFFGAFWALGGGITNFGLAPEFSIPDGQSQVDSFVVDGNTASGTATFTEQDAIYAWIGGTSELPKGVQGTFEVTCAEG